MFLQIAVVQKQVFDFLGFLWIPILVNFFEIIFIILGFFGGYQNRARYIITVSEIGILGLDLIDF